MLVMEKIINKKYFDEFGLIERGYYLNKPQCSFTFCLFTPIFVNIKELLIYGLEGLKICRKFQHQNLQISQGYKNFRLDFNYDPFSKNEV